MWGDEGNRDGSVAGDEEPERTAPLARDGILGGPLRVYEFPEFDLALSEWSRGQFEAVMNDAVAEDIDDREFALRMLARQIVRPAGAGADDLRPWGDGRLEALLRAYIESAPSPFSVDAAATSFDSLRQAVRRRREDEETAFAPLLALVRSLVVPSPAVIASIERAAAEAQAAAQKVAASVPSSAALAAVQQAEAATRASTQLRVTVLMAVNRVVADYAAALRLLAPDSPAREQVRYLLARGWYPSPDAPSFDPEIARWAASGSVIETDRRMADRAERRLDRVAARVRSSFPSRAEVVEDAIWAHRLGLYTLTVPALLAEADGVFHDMFGEQLYKKGGQAARDAMVALLDEQGTGLWRVRTVLLPLDEGSSVMVSTTARAVSRQSDPDYGPLNRHGVLHGIDLDYPTRENSLRAFTLIDYLCWLSEAVLTPLRPAD